MKQAVLCAACLLGLSLTQGCQDSSLQGSNKDGAVAELALGSKPAARVEIAVVESDFLKPVRGMVGCTGWSNRAEVRPHESGIIQEILFTNGATVQEGDVLYRLQAPRGVTPAMGVISGFEAKEKTGAGKAWVEIVAPVSGIIRGGIHALAAQMGGFVTKDQAIPLAVIYQIDPIYVDMPLSKAEVRRLQHDGRTDSGGADKKVIFPVYLQLGDGSWYEHAGTLNLMDIPEAHGESAEKQNGRLLCRAEFPNPEQALKPGLYVNIAGSTEKPDSSLTVPPKAVLRDAKGAEYVLVIDADNRVERRFVRTADMARRGVLTGEAQKEARQVRDGLREGERVVVDGHRHAVPGATVLPVLRGSPDMFPEALPETFPDAPALPDSGVRLARSFMADFSRPSLPEVLAPSSFLRFVRHGEGDVLNFVQLGVLWHSLGQFGPLGAF